MQGLIADVGTPGEEQEREEQGGNHDTASVDTSLELLTSRVPYFQLMLGQPFGNSLLLAFDVFHCFNYETGFVHLLIVRRSSLLDNIGGTFRLRPNPIVTKTGKPIKEELNSWTLLSMSEEKTLAFQHNHSDYRIEVPLLHVRGHEPPDMIVLRGRVFLNDDLEYTFELFTEGMSARDPAELVDDPLARQSDNLYKVLKPHEGRLVSIRFPKDKDGTSYGPEEATLKEVTPHFVKLFIEPIHISFKFWPDMPRSTIPAYTKTVSLAFIKYEEDDEKENRPRLVIEHSHWEHDL